MGSLPGIHPCGGKKSPVSFTSLASGARRRKVTELSGFTCGEVIWGPPQKRACCANSTEWHNRQASVRVTIFLFIDTFFEFSVNVMVFVLPSGILHQVFVYIHFMLGERQ